MKRIILLIISICFAIIVNAQVSSSIFFTNVSCYNGNDGSITFTDTSGATIFEYSIDGGSNWQSSPNFAGLTAQIYMLSVRDAETANRADIGIVQLLQPAVLNATVIAASETFVGAANGVITISVPKGGSGAYEYSTDGITFSSVMTYTGLSTGTYTVWIRDINVPYCMVSMQKIIRPAGSLSADVVAVNITCNTKIGGNNNGSIIISNASGASDYQYSINDGATWENSGNYPTLAAGTYKTMLRDKASPLNKVALDVVTITEPKELEAILSPKLTLCAGTTGSVTVFARGGTGTIVGTGKFIMAAGETRNFIVTDENGCTDSTPFTMPTPQKIVATAKITPPKCNGDDGTVIITAVGGTGTFFGTGTFYVNAGKNYNFAVTDNNGCVSNLISGTMPGVENSEGSLVITETITEIDFQLQRMGAIDLLVTGGSGVFSFRWSNGAITKDLYDLYEGGYYNVTVSDSYGCTISKSITLAVPNYVPIAKTGGDQIVYEGVTVTLDGSGSSDANQDNLSYIWSAPEGIQLSNSTSSKPSFLAPDVKRDTILTFILVVNDGKVNSVPSTVKIGIQNLIQVSNSDISVSDFIVYPNPTTGMVSIEFTQHQAKETEVSVSSMMGVEVFRTKLNTVAKYQFDLSNQVNGIYVLKVKIDNQHYISKIVVK